RCMEKRCPSKSDEANTVTLQFIDKILDSKLHAVEAIRLHVIREHAARCVYGDQQIESFTLYILERVTPAWLCQTNNCQGEPQHMERKSYHAPRPINCSGKLRQQTR